MSNSTSRLPACGEARHDVAKNEPPPKPTPNGCQHDAPRRLRIGRSGKQAFEHDAACAAVAALHPIWPLGPWREASHEVIRAVCFAAREQGNGSGVALGSGQRRRLLDFAEASSRQCTALPEDVSARELLGLAPGFTKAQLRAAWLRLARELHGANTSRYRKFFKPGML